MSVTIDGSNIIKALDKIDLSPEELRKALSKSALLVERDAKKNVASTTHGNGELANSITSVVYDDYAEIGTNKKYGIYVHQGTGLFAVNGDGRKEDLPWHYQDAEGNWHSTSGQHPNPFLEKALDANKDNIIKVFINAMKEET